MKITVEGKTIDVMDKNVRAYIKLNHIEPDELTVKAYVAATYHDNTDNRIYTMSETELSKLVNECIESEVRDCGGNVFYEEA
jgi:hypothetical protein